MCVTHLRRMPWSALSLLAGLAAMMIFAGAAPLAPEPPADREWELQDSDADEVAADDCMAPSCTRARLYPVCRRVCVTKKKPHVEYDVKCELVCIPGCRLLESCRDGCTCGNAVIREKKTLLKKTTEKEVQTYEYKIVWVCRACAFGGGCSGGRGDGP